MTCSRCGEHPRYTTKAGRTYSWCVPCLRENKRNWVLAHREKDRERERRRVRPPSNKEYKQRWAEKNRERTRAAARRWRLAHPELYKARVRACTKKNPEPSRNSVLRRRARKAGVETIVRVDATVCGVCRKPLGTFPYLHPLSTTIGHEPPLAVVARLGLKAVTERPEHRACNRWKSDRLDSELPAERPDFFTPNVLA